MKKTQGILGVKGTLLMAFSVVFPIVYLPLLPELQ
jgi:hypothetical protein